MRILTPAVFVLLCFVSPLISLAQQTYIPGYIILTNNDSLSGFLKMQGSRKASQAAVFRKESKGHNEVYTPDQLKAYRYTGGKYYVSFPLATDGVQKQVFMEYLIKGKANVYYVHDGREHFYIQKEGGELTELTEPITYTTVNGKIYATPSRYKNKLGVILSDADMQSTIQKTSLEYKSLITLAKEYHEKVCNTEICIIYERQKKIVKDFTVFSGYSVSRYTFGNTLVTNYAGGIQAGVQVSFKGLFFSNQKLGLSAGLFLEKDFSFTLKPVKEDGQFYTVDYEGKRYYLSRPNSSVSQSKLDIKANVTSLRIPLTINYYQPVKKSTFIVGLGASNRITISRNEDFKIQNLGGLNEDYETIDTYFLGGTAFIGYQAKFFSSHKITFNITGDYVTAMSTEKKLLGNRLSITQFTSWIGFTF